MLCLVVSPPADRTSPAIREEEQMENGRSPVLSESEGTEQMEGAAAEGRTQRHRDTETQGHRDRPHHRLIWS